MHANEHDTIRAVSWTGNALQLIDQRLLPSQNTTLTFDTVGGVHDAIRDMVVRGAPAIGVTAAYGVVIAARSRFAEHGEGWAQYIEKDINKLAASRPTAVNLFWALERMRTCVDTLGTGCPVDALLAEARRIHEEDIAANHQMGEFGAALIKPDSAVLTHCNTGSLATGGFGTALGVIRAAWRDGRLTQVFADETRPWLQGARLTAWELVQDNIPVTLLADGAGAHLMKQGEVKWVIVGADRIAANGDAANKIGTFHAAIAARYHGVKFMVVAPSSTIDMSIETGAQIPIETRAEQELLELNGVRVAAEGARAWNPSFDVTPAGLIDAIVTERGVVLEPTAEKMSKLMA